ncbi:MAG: hypothetical protein PHC61_16790, partial [Chitinivibrionales bacterium]|nr:hypothetical protein [Chitinivibrionales bacterium]
MKTTRKLFIGLGALAVLSPLGLIAPAYFKAGSAWGEWSLHEIRGLVGYVPDGLQQLSSVWRALIPDYAFNGWENKGAGHLSFAYILSAFIGIALCIGIALLLGKLLSGKASGPREK